MNPDIVESECLTHSREDAEEGKCVATSGRRMDMADTIWAEDDSNDQPIESKGKSLRKTSRKPIQQIPDFTGSTSPREKKILRSPRLTKAAYKTVLETHSLGSFDDDESKDTDIDLTVFMSQYSDALDLGVDNDDPGSFLSFEKSASTLVTVDENHSVTEHDFSNSSFVEDESVGEVQKNRRRRYSKDPGTVWVTDRSASSMPHLELNVTLLTNGGAETATSESMMSHTKPIVRTGRRQARKQRACTQTKLAKEAEAKSMPRKDRNGSQSKVTIRTTDPLNHPNEDLEGSMSSLSESPIIAENRRTRHASALEFWDYLEDKETGHKSFPQPSRSKGPLRQIRGLVVKQRTKKSPEAKDDSLNASNLSLTSPMGPKLTLQNIELIKQMSSKKGLLEEML